MAALRWRWLVIWLALLAGCAAHPAYRPAAGPTQVLVARRGWHIDVGFAAADLVGPLAFIRRQYPAARYVFFGFGDERYVRSVQHHWPVLLAAVWPGRGVMLVTALDNSPAQAFGAAQVVTLPLSQPQRDRVGQFIAGSFAGAGSAAPMREGPYADSLYYEASRRYSGLRTCNTWAAEALRQAGLPVRSRGVLLAGQLWSQVRPLEGAGAGATTP